jgi:hypothetical protein
MSYTSSFIDALRTHRALPLALALTFGLCGCQSLTEVDNPNVVAQDDIEKPASASALLNGALQNTAKALGRMQLMTAIISDHGVWLGTFDNVGELDRGELHSDGGQYSQPAYDDMAVSRWMVDEAIRILEGFDAKSPAELTDRDLLTKAYLYSAINYSTIADMFENFVLSDRRTVSPPVGGDKMNTLYDKALERLAKANAIAQVTRNAELQNQILAWQARTHWAKAQWALLRPRRTPADGRLDVAEANAAAAQLVGRVAADWKAQFRFNPTTGQNDAGFQFNSRREVTFDRSLADHDPSGRAICSPFNTTCTRDGIVVRDPIAQIQDPALRRFMWEFIQGYEHPPITWISVREMRLILAEGALKRGDMATFVTQINAVRSLETGLTPYNPAVQTTIVPLQLLIHMRNVNLIMEPHRRLADMYRFGIRKPRWSDGGAAVRAPGTVLPMSRTENQSNCYIVGSCK